LDLSFFLDLVGQVAQSISERIAEANYSALVRPPVYIDRCVDLVPIAAALDCAWSGAHCRPFHY
jgi:hypothetical protein